MDYISIDIETSGLLPDVHQILEIGAVAVVEGKEVGELNLLVVHEEITFSLEALAIHVETGLLRRFELGVCYHEPLAKDLFQAWVIEHSPSGKIQWAGKNAASFDLPFFEENGYLEGLNCGHRILDPGSMWSRSTDLRPPNLKECCKRAGVDFDESEKHTALPESKLVVQCIQSHFTRTYRA